MAVQGVLAQVGSAPACRYSHGQPTLSIIEDEPILGAIFDA
jgi:hypothetical protein